jgi:ABC-type branched-subunit amino acid transport system permease subunit
LEMLAVSWSSYFATFFLAALACGALSRRGFLPLHVSALIGSGAYIFAFMCGAGWRPIVAGVAACAGTAVLSAATGVVFWRVGGAAASLACMALQLLFDQYARTAAWTGGASGLWATLPLLGDPYRTLVVILLSALGATLYSLYQRTAAARFVVLEGQSRLLATAVGIQRSRRSVMLASCVAGGCAALAGIVGTLQTVIVSPSSFSLYQGLLYVCIVLLVGYRHLGAIAMGSVLFAVFPEVLRLAGLGNIEASAWRGVVLGLAVFVVALLQTPRARSKTSATPIGAVA